MILDQQAAGFHKVIRGTGVLPSCFSAIPYALGLVSLITGGQAQPCSHLGEGDREHGAWGRGGYILRLRPGRNTLTFPMHAPGQNLTHRDLSTRASGTQSLAVRPGGGQNPRW